MTDVQQKQSVNIILADAYGPNQYYSHVRVVVHDGALAIWQEDLGFKKAKRKVFVPEGVAFTVRAAADQNHVIDTPSGQWEISELYPGCSCVKRPLKLKLPSQLVQPGVEEF